MANKLIEQQRFMCAIGAIQTVVAIPKAVPLLHSGPGCGTMVQGFFERSTGYAGGSTSPCTNFTESEVVFGGEDKLRKILSNTYKVLDTQLQVILTGCTSAIVGDDVNSVARQFGEEGKPVVYVETAGFKYTNYQAHSLVVNAIIDQFVNKVYDKAAAKDANLVNIFASIPYQDPFWKGNLEEIKRLLEGIGLKVNILFGPNSNGVSEWKTIPQAGFNVLISPWYGTEIVENLKAKYNQPFYQFPYIPIGGNETTKFLRELIDYANKNGAKLNKEKADAFIALQEQDFYEEIDNLATFLLEFRYGLPNFFHVLSDSAYVLGISKFLLNEVGIVPKEQFIMEQTPEQYQQKILDIAKTISNKREIPVFFEPDGGLAQETIRKAVYPGRGLIIGGAWDKELAKEKDYDFLSAGLPSTYRLILTTPYFGYKGGLRLIEDIYNAVLATYK
ncbi:nitrogenase component 1 [Endomicrobium proavitum]|uniref:Nitrogenase beta subunit n=1 Tax=Endomicrobium proavitum TaxID=1408281 RepID=A0A0G3WJK8_9BACT|nr:nitrogenase component 1 [Endomicrobium proavitum]AKL98065.1 Nitrogenase beta subunit [Endomicrobium proavitum]